jgi:hypothetical protein
MNTLEEVMAYINNRYRFTENEYPALRGGVSPDDIAAFAANHTLLHFLKAIGTVAAVCEAHDHGAPLDLIALQAATVKMFINTLKLASELGMSDEELVAAVPTLMKPTT